MHKRNTEERGLYSAEMAAKVQAPFLLYMEEVWTCGLDS